MGNRISPFPTTRAPPGSLFPRGFLTAYLPYDNKGAIYYKLTEPLDKEALFSFLDPSAPDPDPDPTPPTLDLFFDHPELGQNPLSASRTILSESREGVLQKERPYWQWEGDPSGIAGFPTEEVGLDFSLPRLPGGTILVQQLDGGREYSLPLDGLVGNALPLAPYSARYTITASFSHPVQNTVYEAQFCFDVRLPWQKNPLWQNQRGFFMILNQFSFSGCCCCSLRNKRASTTTAATARTTSAVSWA